MKQTINKTANCTEKASCTEGAVRRKKGSKKLYVDFYLHGFRVVKSTGLDDTEENRLEAEEILRGLMKKRAEGTLIFAKAFPGASNEEKALHAKFEGREYRPEPQNVNFGKYVREWKDKIWANYSSENKKDDYEQVIDDWLLPYFGSMNFDDFTGVVLQMFIGQLRWRSGKNKGNPLSGSRVRNILIPLRAIWRSARSKYRWTFLEDPFVYVNDEKAIPRKATRTPAVFRFAEWNRILTAMDPFYIPIAEIMILTGMIGSEMAGLRKMDIVGNVIHVVNSIVPRRKSKERREKEELKNEFRSRDLRITKAIRRRLDIVIARSSSDYVFTMKDGSPFDPNNFCQGAWETAFRRAKLPYKKPYTTRHSFAAWSLTIRIDPNRLVYLMGHNSKKMIYETYGEYVEGLEEDFGFIRDYFGDDFIFSKNRNPLALSPSDSESLVKVC